MQNTNVLHAPPPQSQVATAIITTTNPWTGTQSFHDNTDIEFNTIVSKYDNNPVQRLWNWGQTKQWMLENIAVINNKDFQKGIWPVTMNETGLSRLDINIKNRTMVLFDFDSNGNIEQILDPLSSFVYMAWTTYSHQIASDKPGKNLTNRYRVMLPLLSPIPANDWETDYQFRIKDWGDSNWLGSNELDETYRRVGQFGYVPSINPDKGDIQIWINDGNATECMDLITLPVCQIPVPTKKTKKQNNTNTNVVPLFPSCNTSTANIDKVLEHLLQKPELQHIPANNFTSGQAASINRYYMASALIALGGDYAAFQALDTVMCKPSSSKNSNDVWNAATHNPNPHAGIILQLLGALARIDCGLSSSTYQSQVYKTQWDIEHNVEYISQDIVGNGKKVLLCADMGTGKNHLWSHLDLEQDWRVIVLSPLRTIVHQQGSDNSIKDKDNRTFTYDQAIRIPSLIEIGNIDPAKTILVIDECHNLSLAQYRLNALAHLEYTVDNYDWHQVVYQSATITPDTFEGYMAFDSKIKVVKQTPTNLYYQPIYAVGINNTHATIVNILTTFKANYQGKALILLNDTDKQSELKIKLKKEGFDAETISAVKTRDASTEAYQVAQSVDYKMDDIDVFIGTNSLVEGINIQDPIEDALVIVVGEEPCQLIKQLSGRLRKAKNVYTYHIANFCHKTAWGSEGKEAWVKAKQFDSKMKSLLVNELIANNDYQPFDYSVIRNSKFGGMIEAADIYKNYCTKQYEQHNLGQLWLSAEIEQNEMYESFGNATAAMREQGYQSMPSDMFLKRIKLEDDIRKAHNLERKARNVRFYECKKLHFYKLCAEVIDEIVAGDYPLEYEHIATWLLRVAPNSYAPIYWELLDIIKYQLLLKPANLMALTERVDEWLKGEIKPATLEMEYRVLQEKGVIAAIKTTYPSGQQLSKDQQRGVLVEFITMMIKQEMYIPNSTEQQAFALVMNTPRFIRGKTDISFVKGQVIVNVARPMTLLKNILDMTSKTIKHNGSQVQVGIVK